MCILFLIFILMCSCWDWMKVNKRDSQREREREQKKKKSWCLFSGSFIRRCLTYTLVIVNCVLDNKAEYIQSKQHCLPRMCAFSSNEQFAILWSWSKTFWRWKSRHAINLFSDCCCGWWWWWLYYHFSSLCLCLSLSVSVCLSVSQKHVWVWCLISIYS